MRRLSRLGRIEYPHRFATPARNAGLPNIERDALAFDGLVDHAYLTSVLTGIGTRYHVAIKLASAMDEATANGAPFVLQTFGNRAGGDTNRDRLYRAGASGSGHISGGLIAATGLDNYIASTASQTAGRKVLSIYRESGVNAQARMISASGVEWAASPATTEYREPEHICLGARHSTDAPGGYVDLRAPIQFISLVISATQISDAALLAWLLDDAGGAPAHITGIHTYAVASDAIGSSIAPRIGSVATTLVGVTSADLVPL